MVLMNMVKNCFIQEIGSNFTCRRPVAINEINYPPMELENKISGLPNFHPIYPLPFLFLLPSNCQQVSISKTALIHIDVSLYCMQVTAIAYVTELVFSQPICQVKSLLFQLLFYTMTYNSISISQRQSLLAYQDSSQVPDR